MDWSHNHVWWIQIWEGYLRSEESQPHTRPLAHSSRARKISPHNFWLQKPVGMNRCKKLLDPKQFPLKNPCTDLFRLTRSELQHWGSSLKAPVAHRKELMCLASRRELESAFFQTERQAEANVLFLSPLPTEPQSRQAGTLSEILSTWLTWFALS